MNEQVREKIQMLYEMEILHKNGRKHDVRERRVRKILLTAKTEIQLENMIHDVVVENITLNKWLMRKELELHAIQTAAR